MSIKKILKESLLSSPQLRTLVYRFLRLINYPLGWEYVPQGWRAEKTNSVIKGWNDPSVLDAYKAEWPDFLKNIEGTRFFGSPESRSNAPHLIFHNTMMTYAYVLSLVARQKTAISMLDWGGTIGHYYLISQKLIPDLKIDYHCKDVPILAEYGAELLPETHFYSDETCLDRKYDFILASSSFQYTQNWTELLKKLAQSTAGHLFITRQPIVHEVPSYVMVQRPYYRYQTEYLGWCLNRQELLQCADSLGLKLIREFYIGEKPFIFIAPESCEYWGFLFDSKQ
jgi:putative methyltransferase (TIGR04325 family)